MAITQRQPAPRNDDDISENPRVAIGGNAPPPEEQARADFNEALDAALRKRGLTRARFSELASEAGRAFAVDEESVGRCGELVKSLRAAMKLIEDVHKEVKAPYLNAGREIDGLKNALLPDLDRAKREVEAKQQVYLEEQERVRQAEIRRLREIEAAEQRKREEERRAAEAANAPLPEEPEPVVQSYVEPEREIIRGDFGAAVSGQKVWKSEVVDYEVAFMAVADNAKVREAIDAAIAGMVRAGARKIEGVRIFETIKASNR